MINYEKDLLIFDLETPRKCFLACFYIPQEDRFIDFLINKNRNDFQLLMKFITDNKDKYFVGYNNINFDNQILEYAFRNADRLSLLSSSELALELSDFGSAEIEKQNFGLFSSYREQDFTFKALDLPRIWHFFNENKRVSLKQLEYEMRAETIENFEFDMDQEFKEEDIEKLVYYCHNDIKYTFKHFKYTIGDTNHILYRNEDKIVDRFDIMEEMGMDCLNWDDVKIGAESNKKAYLEATGRDEKDLKPKRINSAYGKPFKTFFPKTVRFVTKKVQDFVKNLGNEVVKKLPNGKKQEFKIRMNSELELVIAKGGIHSTDKPRKLEPEEDEIYLQCDIGGQYPNAMVKFKVFVKHLGMAWNGVIGSNIVKRDFHKKRYKTDKNRKDNSIQKMLKLANNGGSYGKLNSKGDWQNDPCAMYQVTVGCQLEILMIIERLLESKFRVVSANTDGFDLILKRDRLDEFFTLMSELEVEIGNDKIGNFEYTEFYWIAQLTVNDYLAKKKGEWVDGKFIPHTVKDKDDDLKSKGDFEYWKELNKNTSFSIIPLALQKYYNEGVDFREFIMNHDDIFDFCARSNSGWDFTHTGYKDNGSFTLPKLLRYYVSKDGIHIKKIVKPTCITNANDTNVRPAEHVKTPCNTLTKDTWEEHLKNVNREWYINEVELIIRSVITSKKKNTIKLTPKEQLGFGF